MKTKETIQNEYAVKKGFSDFSELIDFYALSNKQCIHHINAVTDLIQKELLNRVSETAETTTETNCMDGECWNSNIFESKEDCLDKILKVVRDEHYDKGNRGRIFKNNKKIWYGN